MTGWKVKLHGKEINKVFGHEGCTVDDVKRSLVNHDGYDPAIVVIKERKRPVKLPFGVRVVKTIDGEYMILSNGFQWGPADGPLPDRSGAYAATWPTKAEAIKAYMSEWRP